MKRTIQKRELARKLYPDSISDTSAMELMRREINHSQKLKEQLAQAGHMSKHYFNHRQLQIILDHLDISTEEFSMM